MPEATVVQSAGIPEGIIRVLEKREEDSSEWAKVLRAYKSLFIVRESVDRLLDILHPELEDVIERLRRAERDAAELAASVADKPTKQDVTEDFSIPASAILIYDSPTLYRIGKSNARKQGRPLLQRLHPDKGGDPHLFDLARKAIEAGDVELVQIFLFKMGQPTSTPEDLEGRIQARLEKLRGSRIWGCVSLAATGNKEESVKALKELLEARILQFRLF